MSTGLTSVVKCEPNTFDKTLRKKCVTNPHIEVISIHKDPFFGILIEMRRDYVSLNFTISLWWWKVRMFSSSTLLPLCYAQHCETTSENCFAFSHFLYVLRSWRSFVLFSCQFNINHRRVNSTTLAMVSQYFSVTVHALG